jgi:hypothetical protein
MAAPDKSEQTGSGSSSGPATDRQNNPVVDPTANVLNLVGAAIDRVNDLREAAVERQDNMRELEFDSLRREAHIRATYEEKLRQAETERINAIRAVDVAAVAQAQQQAEVRATALAAQVAASAEAMRSQVAAAAQAAATSLGAALEPVQKDIADLRRNMYEQQGQKSQVVETRAQGSQNGMWIGIAISGVVLLISIIGIAITLELALGK